MRGITKFIITVVVALLLMLVVRNFLLLQLTVTNDARPQYFFPGDRVLVNRVAYGFRIPQTYLWRTHCYWVSQPKKGDWIAFNDPMDKNYNPTSRAITIGRCDALAGDTVWIDSINNDISLSPHYGLMPFVVPGRKIKIAVNKWNIRLSEYLMRRFEGKITKIDDGQLYISGRQCDSIFFSQNYCWVSAGSNIYLPDSRVFGFVPHSHLIGKLWRYSYSIDIQKKFPHNFREGRSFQLFQ